MEVHSHSHHPKHKKKWLEYVSEFAMLFLAVFLGFTAENIREHRVENKRGINYVGSFVEDLKTDTAQFSSLITSLTNKIDTLNNLEACFTALESNPDSSGCLKSIVANSFGFLDFIYTDRTILQLNAGNFRLIHDEEITEKIMAYNALVQDYLIHQKSMEKKKETVVEAHLSMVNFSHLSNIRENRVLSPMPYRDSILITTDKASLHSYFNKIFDFRITLYRQLVKLKNLKVKATKLIEYLNKKL